MIKKAKGQMVRDNKKNRLYLANMSHEIRTPMNAIVGLANLLLKKVKDPEEREYLHQMETATRNLLMTLNGILDYDNLISGEIKISNEPFDITQLIDEVISIAKINVSENNVNILVNADPNIPALLIGDSLRIKQVLVQLMSNACKFTKEGSICLSLTSEIIKNNCRINFRVCDTGLGMSEETIRRAFLPYEQANISSSRNAGGLGIGLTIANALVNLMGGEIDIQSKEGEGTSISFTLSLEIEDNKRVCEVENPDNLFVAICIGQTRQAEMLKCLFERLNVGYVNLSNVGEIFVENERNKITHFFVDHEKYTQLKYVDEAGKLGLIYAVLIDNIKQAVPNAGTRFIKKPLWYRDVVNILNGGGLRGYDTGLEVKESIMTSGARILVVDDNDINLKVTRGLLSPYGVSIDTAGSAEEGIRLIRKIKYDLVFMDYMMPEMDGVEATKIIRQYEDPYYKSLPIIALSANAIEGAEELFKEAGMNDYIPKPIDIGNLEEAIIKWLPPEKVKKDIVEVKISEPEDERFKGLKSVDVAIGLSYTNGNSDMYYSVLKDFASSIPDKKELINRLVREEDVARFTIEVHSLKSTSKIMGAIMLSEKALELERLGHKRDLEEIVSRIPQLNKEIDKVYDDLKELAVKSSSHVARIPVERDKVRDALRQIFYATKDFDYDKAQEIIISLGEYQFDGRMETVYVKMKDSIENVNYEAARKGAVEMLANI